MKKSWYFDVLDYHSILCSKFSYKYRSNKLLTDILDILSYCFQNNLLLVHLFKWLFSFYYEKNLLQKNKNKNQY